MGKSKNKIRISFPSASAESVAGSQVLIEFGKDDQKQKVLIECGLIQGESTPLKEYHANSKKFAFKPKDLTAVFALHLHADHTGLIPKLYKEGCTAPLILPQGSSSILKEMLIDSSKIMQKDAAYLSKKFDRSYDPIYEIEDVQDSLSHIVEYPVHDKIQLNDNISFQFVNSGHIINSCQLILWIKNNNNIKKIAITSDLGNKSLFQYYTEDFEPIESANLIIGESTYSNPKRQVKSKDREKDLEKLKASIDCVCNDRKGRVLIPAFSLQRFQVLLTHIYDIFKDDESCPEIYAASPLACKISELFISSLKNEEQVKKWNTVKQWNKIHFIDKFEDVVDQVKFGGPCVFVASAGMLNAGFSAYIASELLPKPNDMILFCGFMAENTLGSKIKDKKTKTVTIDQDRIPARCSVMALNSFTSHMQYNDLLWYYSSFNYDKIALVHGEFSDKLAFSKVLQEEINKKNKTGKVVCVNKSTEILL